MLSTRPVKNEERAVQLEFDDKVFSKNLHILASNSEQN